MKKRYKIIIAFLHGIVLFTGLWLITNSTYTSVADEAILKQVNTLQQRIWGNRLVYPHDFIFINVSKDQKLIPDPVDYGDISITDREKLAAFFKMLADNNNQHYAAMCDIILEDETEQDTLLEKEVQRCKKIWFPYQIQNDSIIKPVIDVPIALSYYITNTRNFSKFQVKQRDSLKTTPLVLLENLDRKTYPSTFPYFRSVFPKYYIQPADLFVTKKYPYFNLGEMIALAGTDSFYHKFLYNRFIIIGNFDTDMHNSPVGRIQGPLILLNTYLTIRKGNHSGWLWVIFMVLGFSAASYFLFFKKVKAPDIKKNIWLDFFMQLFINRYISFSGICLVLVILSSLLFSVQPNMASVLLYLLVLNFFRDFYKKHFKKEPAKNEQPAIVAEKKD